LRALGFGVIEAHDLNQTDMQTTARRFSQELESGDTGLFFYKGAWGTIFRNTRSYRGLNRLADVWAGPQPLQAPAEARPVVALTVMKINWTWVADMITAFVLGGIIAAAISMLIWG
jgi:uncharacterized caspase-like protein